MNDWGRKDRMYRTLQNLHRKIFCRTNCLPGLKELDLSGRKVALFGLGDLESYPETFADALGTLHESLLSTGCEIIGSCSANSYDFIESAAVRNGKFAGLVLDEKNQPELTDQRIQGWLHKIIPDYQVT